VDKPKTRNASMKKLPKRLVHLRKLPFAQFIGRTPAGVDWVAYKEKDVAPMTRRFITVMEKHGVPRRISGITTNQMYMIDDEIGISREGGAYQDLMSSLRTGRTYVQGTHDDLQELADRIKDKLDDDHRAIVEGNSLKDLTDAQVKFGVKARIKSIRSLVKKLHTRTLH